MVMKVMWIGIGLISICQFLIDLRFHNHGGKRKENEENQGERGEYKDNEVVLTRAKQYPQGFIEKNKRIAKR
jgi:hypothetical protein